MGQLSVFDLRTAFALRLAALVQSNLVTVQPDEVLDLKRQPNSARVRRGTTLIAPPDTIAFGNGVYSRTEGIYQIDIWVPISLPNALEELDRLGDLHLGHFFPINGRGLTLTRNATSAVIYERPVIRPLDRQGSYLFGMVEVNFYVDTNPEG